ncbi:hypothetical protein IQ07DRAFT_582977 [Pyrenochaeta sp. DS3sAY3a]|nr:hypothetical protein IQ07DRAFT_582977 [Pyrenochaeta sp. DS3sAY3a]
MILLYSENIKVIHPSHDIYSNLYIKVPTFNNYFAFPQQRSKLSIYRPDTPGIIPKRAFSGKSISLTEQVKLAPGWTTLYPLPCQARVLSLCFVEASCAHIMPAAAADESRAISQARNGGYRVLIGLFIPLVILIGQNVVAYFGALVGPFMGITSLLWLMMRNDAAIDPKASWM